MSFFVKGASDLYGTIQININWGINALRNKASGHISTKNFDFALEVIKTVGLTTALTTIRGALDASIAILGIAALKKGKLSKSWLPLALGTLLALSIKVAHAGTAILMDSTFNKVTLALKVLALTTILFGIIKNNPTPVTNTPIVHLSPIVSVGFQ